jgi:GT2 family glycosyltransferase
MKAIEKTKDIGITEVNLVAGFFMLFQKKTWKAVNGFHEFDKTFDVKFCKAVRECGGKIGIINKLYMFHLYRVWAEKNPSFDTKHLL